MARNERPAALTRVDLSHTPDRLEFWAGLFPHGYLSIVAALAGVGKTVLLTYLMWQASRENGGYFLGRRVEPAPCIYLDFDAPGDGRNILYWLDKHEESYPDGDRSKIIALEPGPFTGDMNKYVVKELRAMILESNAGVLILDSFMAAFPNTDQIKANTVMGPMTTLRQIASDLGIPVVVIDHLPKPMAGEQAGARGVMGSVAKTAQARSVHILTRLAKEQVGNANVLKWAVDKMSYGRRPEPFGVELKFQEHGLSIEPYDLPDESPTNKTATAQRAMLDHLEANRGATVSRKTLLGVAIDETGASQRTAELALQRLQSSLDGELITTAMPGVGNPTGYRLIPHALGNLAVNALNTVQDEETITAKGFA